MSEIMLQTYDPEIHHRRSIRKRGYDYSFGGVFFITICTDNKKPILGRVQMGEMNLNSIGKVVHDCLLGMQDRNTRAVLHEWVVMPNHVHFILEIKIINNGAQLCAPTRPHLIRGMRQKIRTM
ncbi:MAG: glucose-6-phosphate dehydrogenase [Proteobacteria bacterium]|nr:glucose-6-phosphate dehydrogenase [Pseudomonadota bacterium]